MNVKVTNVGYFFFACFPDITVFGFKRLKVCELSIIANYVNIRHLLGFDIYAVRVVPIGVHFVCPENKAIIVNENLVNFKCNAVSVVKNNVSIGVFDNSIRIPAAVNRGKFKRVD